MLHSHSLIFYPNPILKKKSQKISPIKHSKSTLLPIIEQMFNIMIKEDGIGLAANQIGLDISLAIVYIQEIENTTFEDFLSQGYILINPEITFQSVETAIYKEGCLSIPTILAEVTRPKEITLTYQDTSYNTHTLNATDLLATCIQHEVDHLNGILFTDRLTPFKRNFLLKKYKKNQQKEL